MPRIADFVQGLKDKTEGWSVFHSILDSLVDRVLGLLILGVPTTVVGLAGCLSLSLAWAAVVAVGLGMTIVGLMRFAVHLRALPTNRESIHPLQTRIKELIGECPREADCDDRRASLWFAAVIDLMWRCDEASWKSLTNLRNEVDGFQPRRPNRDIVEEGVNVLKNFLALPSPR